MSASRPASISGTCTPRSQGVEFAEATAAEDYAALLDKLQQLGPERAAHFHAHFSRIAYTKGGEKCHLTFADTQYGPPHAPLLALLKERGLAPTIICESAGTQAEDAAVMSRDIRRPVRRRGKKIAKRTQKRQPGSCKTTQYPVK